MRSSLDRVLFTGFRRTRMHVRGKFHQDASCFSINFRIRFDVGRMKMRKMERERVIGSDLRVEENGTITLWKGKAMEHLRF